MLLHRAPAVGRSQGGSNSYNRPHAPASLQCAAAQLPALADLKKGASFSYTTIKSCSFPNPHYMPHANKVTMPVSGAPLLVWGRGGRARHQPQVPRGAVYHPVLVWQ